MAKAALMRLEFDESAGWRTQPPGTVSGAASAAVGARLRGAATRARRPVPAGFHKVGFEGGQMPLHRRLPKRGFRSITRRFVITVRLGDLERLKADEIDLAVLKPGRAGLHARAGSPDRAHRPDQAPDHGARPWGHGPARVPPSRPPAARWPRFRSPGPIASRPARESICGCSINVEPSSNPGQDRQYTD